MIMQTAFFKLTKVIPLEEAIAYLKESIDKDITETRATISSR